MQNLDIPTLLIIGFMLIHVVRVTIKLRSLSYTQSLILSRLANVEWAAGGSVASKGVIANQKDYLKGVNDCRKGKTPPLDQSGGYNLGYNYEAERLNSKSS